MDRTEVETQHESRSPRTSRRPVSTVTLAVLFALALGAGQAHAATINFDDLTSAPGHDSATGLPVNTQYESQGVTFSDPNAFDYAKPTAIPGFAHSGTIGVEPCPPVAEFCTAKLVATFTTPQRDVGVWVGYSYRLTEPLGVRLTAFDANDAVVGTDNATLPANSSPTPIQTHLEVKAPPPRIVRLEVSVTTNGGFSSSLAVDDVEFSTAGPPPPCTATSVPIVSLNQPNSFTTVQNNEFLLEGNVDTAGAPITSASVSVTSSSAVTHTGSAYPSLIDSDGGHFGPIRYNGALFDPAPGSNNIVVSATNCKGTGSSGSRRLFWTPLPSTTSFRQLAPIEVTQSVQTKLNSVPLVAGSANGVKRTFARVYLHAEGSGGRDITHVQGTLTATLADGSRAPGPLRVWSINPAPAYGYIGTGPLVDARTRLDDPLTFELPPQWLNAGRLHLELEHIYIEGEQSNYPCEECDNSGFIPFPLPGHTGPFLVRFHQTPPLHLWLISMPYMHNGSPVVPGQLEIDNISSVLRRMYPTAQVDVTQTSMQTANDPPATCHEAQSRMSDFISTIPAAQNGRTKFLGVLEGNPDVQVMDGDNVIGGCADRPGNHGWAYAQPADGAAHEIGHMFGRKHVEGGAPGSVQGDCELFPGSTVDSAYPHPGGLIGDANTGDALGFDAGDAALGLPNRLLDWRSGVADIMSYCANKWISDWNYGFILGGLCSHDLANCPDHVAITGSKARPAPRQPKQGQAARKPAGRPRLSVSGSVSRAGHASLDSLAVMRRLRLSGRPKKSPYAIMLRDGGGRVIGRYRFKPTVVEESSTKSIGEVVPFKAATKRISIVKDKKTLDTVSVSAHAPRVAITAPKKGGRLRHSVKLRWRSRDADGGHPTYTVLYTPNGKRYIPVVAGLHKRSYKVDLSQLPGGSRARLRVIANDGVLTGSDDSKRFKVKAKNPHISISSVTSGEDLTAGQPVALVASVTDLQDVRFDGANVVWRSSLQGKLGHGTAIAATLSPGTHKITATATNSAGRSSMAAVTVNVAAKPPVLHFTAAAP